MFYLNEIKTIWMKQSGLTPTSEKKSFECLATQKGFITSLHIVSQLLGFTYI